jgi:hypothetical protein
LGSDLNPFGICADDVMPKMVTKGSLVGQQSFIVSTGTVVVAAQPSADTAVTDVAVTDVAVTDVALALAGIESPTSAVTTSSVEARDAVFESVDGSSLLLALKLVSDDADYAQAENQLASDADAKDEPFGSLDDVFELLSVA